MLAPAATPLFLLSYARISADKADDAHGVEGQHRDHDAYCARRGWQVVFRATDNDKSASDPTVYRDDFWLMVKYLNAGRLPDGTPINGVIIERFDRASRTLGDIEKWHDALISEPGRICIVDGAEKDPYSEGFLWEIAAAMVGAKTEIRKIKARAKTSHRRRAADGLPVGGNRPFGWKADRRTLNPDEALHLREAIRRYVAGETLNSIVRYMTEQGCTTPAPANNPWTSHALRQAILNPRVCGYRKLDGELVRDDKGQPRVGVWEPVVPVAMWEAAVARAEGAARRPEARNARHLLVGILRCGKINPDTGLPCLTKLRTSYIAGTHGHTYQCPTKYNGGCAGVGRNGLKVDAFVLETLMERLDAQTWSAEPIARWDGEAALAAEKEAKAALTTAWQNKQISNDLFFSQVGLLEDKIKTLEKQQRNYNRKLAAITARPDDPRTELTRLRQTEDLGGLRAFVAAHISAIIVKPVPKGTKYLRPEHFEIAWVGQPLG